MESRMLIGVLASTTGCTVQTIRYYEQIGLLPAAHRTTGNQRVYGPETVERLHFVRHARSLGFSLDAIKELCGLSDQPDESCKAADKIARQQLKEVEDRIRRLRLLKGELKEMINRCSGKKVSDCTIVASLRDPAVVSIGEQTNRYS